jgi:hypothetical protein
MPKKIPNPALSSDGTANAGKSATDSGLLDQTPETMMDALRKVHNQQVKQVMADQKDYAQQLEAFISGKNSDPNFGGRMPTPNNNRQRLLLLCFMFDKEPIQVAQTKVMLFNFYVRPNVPDGFYGLPSGLFHDSVEFYPQIELLFRETVAQQVKAGRKYPVHSSINIRWRVSEAEVSSGAFDSMQETMARKIASEFKGYKLERGTIKASYYDKAKSYHLTYFAKNEASAKEFFTKVLSLQGDSFEDENFTIAERRASFTADQFKTIGGKRVKMPRKRPVADIKFYGSNFKVHGIIPPRCLVDAGCGGNNPIVIAY